MENYTQKVASTTRFHSSLRQVNNTPMLATVPAQLNNKHAKKISAKLSFCYQRVGQLHTSGGSRKNIWWGLALHHLEGNNG